MEAEPKATKKKEKKKYEEVKAIPKEMVRQTPIPVAPTQQPPVTEPPQQRDRESDVESRDDPARKIVTPLGSNNSTNSTTCTSPTNSSSLGVKPLLLPHGAVEPKSVRALVEQIVSRNDSPANENITRPPAPPPFPMTTDRKMYISNQCFNPISSEQIPVGEGDIIEVVSAHESGWSYGKNHSISPGDGIVEGWFPTWVASDKISEHEALNHLTELEQQQEQARITVHQPFQSGDVSQLSLNKGDSVIVIERHTTGWTFGRHVETQKEGWFPDWVKQS